MRSLNRRSFIITTTRLAGMLAAGALLEACGGGAAPASSAPASGNSGAAKAAAGSSTPASASSAASASAAKPAASAKTSGSALAGNLKKVRYGDLKLLGDAGIYIGLEEGYFAEQGIELDLTSFDSAANMVAPLGAGQIDAGGGASSAGLWNAIARGLDLKLVADKGHSDPTPPGFDVSDYIVRKALVDSGRYKSVADLKGLKFAQAARGISPELDNVALLKTGGLTYSDVEHVYLGFPDMVPAFANGSIDVAGVVEPFATAIKTQGTGVHIKYDYEVNPKNQVAVILYSATFSKSDLAEKFMVAYVKGLRVYNDAFVKGDAAARDKAVKAMIAHTPVKDRALYDKIKLNGLDPDGKMNVKSLADQQDYFLSSGAQQTKVDISKYVDESFLQKAVAQLGPYK